MATPLDEVRIPSLREVETYRGIIRELGSELARASTLDSDASRTRELLTSHLSGDQAAPVVLAAAGSSRALVDRAAEAMRSYERTAAATAQTPVEMVTILLLQQIDLAWWSATPDFETEEQLAESPALADLRELAQARQVKFAYSLASDRVAYRARNYAIRRWFPGRGPGTSGPSSSLVRPQLVGVLNLLADRFSQLVGPSSPPLWVNSITRPLDHQLRLQRLGFTAHIPSAHCRGWAADIETAWYERFGLRAQLESMLQDFVESGTLNGIDEGRIWHVCPNPERLGEVSKDIN